MNGNGAAANRHGKANELNIKGVLADHHFRQLFIEPKLRGWAAIKSIKEQATSGTLFGNDIGVFGYQVWLGTGLYGKNIREDFVLYRDGWPDALAISAKHQGSDGSVLQKLEYTFAEIVECYPCRGGVILDGPCFDEGVLLRAEHHVRKSGGQLACIWPGVSDFRRWLTNGAQWPGVTPRELF